MPINPGRPSYPRVTIGRIMILVAVVALACAMSWMLVVAAYVAGLALVVVVATVGVVRGVKLTLMEWLVVAACSISLIGFLMPARTSICRNRGPQASALAQAPTSLPGPRVTGSGPAPISRP